MFELDMTMLIGLAILAMLVILWLVFGRARRQEILREEADQAERRSAAEKDAKTDELMVRVTVPTATPTLAGLTPPPPPPVAEPAEPAPAPVVAAAAGAPDNLRLMKGVGPKLQEKLNAMGIVRFDQIAAWSEADIAEIDAHLGNFKGRITRDNWVDQARYLAAGDKAGFEAHYGALEGDL